MNARFKQYIDSLGLRHFSAEEFLIKKSRGGVTNIEPPETLWPNIELTARVLDEMREIAGGAIEIHSAYRSPAYNRAVGGEKNSFHMRFMAIDVVCKTKSPKQLHKIAVSLRGKKFGGKIFRGGIGLYPGFIHIDCRSYEANW